MRRITAMERKWSLPLAVLFISLVQGSALSAHESDLLYRASPGSGISFSEALSATSLLVVQYDRLYAASAMIIDLRSGARSRPVDLVGCRPPNSEFEIAAQGTDVLVTTCNKGASHWFHIDSGGSKLESEKESSEVDAIPLRPVATSLWTNLQDHLTSVAISPLQIAVASRGLTKVRAVAVPQLPNAKGSTPEHAAFSTDGRDLLAIVIDQPDARTAEAFLKSPPPHRPPDRPISIVLKDVATDVVISTQQVIGRHVNVYPTMGGAWATRSSSDGLYAMFINGKGVDANSVVRIDDLERFSVVGACESDLIMLKGEDKVFTLATLHFQGGRYASRQVTSFADLHPQSYGSMTYDCYSRRLIWWNASEVHFVAPHQSGQH